MKKFTGFILGGSLILTIIISNFGGFIRDGRRLDSLRNSVLRLHILADSDTEYAQSLKLKVRDGLLAAGIFTEVDSLNEAEAIAAENLTNIENKAEEILRENGCFLPVTAELADVVFDERVYDDITMPAGEYRALRIKIGSAQGKNWWCVLFPTVCIRFSRETADEDAYIAAGFTPEEYRIITGNDGGWKIKFRILEILADVFER